jgi:GGDEF domain-containing protein
MKMTSILRIFGHRTLMLIYILLIGCVFLIFDLVSGGDILALPLRTIPLLIGLAIAIYSIQNSVIHSLEIEISKTETENKTLEMKLNTMDSLESHDAVTGLPTFVFQKDRVAAAIQRAKRKSRHLAIYRIQAGACISSTSGFEELSDSHVIAQKAERMKNLLRDSDSIMHIGRTDFLIIAESIKDMEDILRINQKLESTLKAPIVMNDGSLATVIDKSAIAIYPFDGEDADSLLAVAEDNLNTGNYWSGLSKSRIHPPKGFQRVSSAA